MYSHTMTFCRKAACCLLLIAGSSSAGEANPESIASKFAEAAQQRERLAHSYADTADKCLDAVQAEKNAENLKKLLRTSISYRVVSVGQFSAALANWNNAYLALRDPEYKRKIDELMKEVEMGQKILMQSYRDAIETFHDLKIPEEVTLREEFARLLESRAAGELKEAMTKPKK